MERTFELAIPNDKPGWAEVLEDALLEKITSQLRTRRKWQVEDAVEGGQAGWLAYSRDEERQYVLSLSTPALAKVPPHLIQWELTAQVLRSERGRLRLPLGAIMAGSGAAFGVLGRHLGVSAFWQFVAVIVGIVPIGLVLGIVTLQPVANRRQRGPIPGGESFFDEVKAARDHLATR
jgi:hypothetical protein